MTKDELLKLIIDTSHFEECGHIFRAVENCGLGLGRWEGRERERSEN